MIVGDCHHLGIKNNFDHHRFIKFARVCEVEGEKKQICTREKEVGNLYDFFHTRNSLHRSAYKHKVTNIVETMINEAFVLADSHLTFKGLNGASVTMSRAIDDMVAYTKVTDNVFEQILFPNFPEQKLTEAREILKKVLTRRLYKCLGHFYSAKDWNNEAMQPELEGDQGNNLRPKDIIENSIRRELEGGQGYPPGNNLRKDEIIVKVIKMDYGMEKKDPIDHVRFYRKSDPDSGFKIQKGQVSTLIPEHFQEWLIRVYCKRTDEESLGMAKERFKQWCNAQNEPAGAGNQ